ncbi:MAG: acetylesterase [Betaproteobacteria bacterium]|nr:acetylesterase [Betaproteobacteria bacterium]
MTAALDPDYVRATDEVKKAGMGTADPLKMPLTQAREMQRRYFQFLAGEVPEVAAVQDYTLRTDFAPFRVRLYFPSLAKPLPVLVFTRGAGWWAGDLDSHDRTMRLLARKSGMAVCGVDYHCAPEARFPVQLDELLAAVRWLRTEGTSLGIDSGRMVLIGESAGATLSALAASRLGNEQVNGLVLFYGNFSGPSERSREYSRWVWSNFLGDSGANTAAVPLHADLSRLPPTWLGVGECDPLITDTMEFAERLESAGIPHTVRRYPGVPHAFLMMSRLFDGADRALTDAAEVAQAFVRRPES